jgi:hypothetical protein
MFDGRSQIGLVGSVLQSALVALVHSTHEPLGPHIGFVPSRAVHAVPSLSREASHGRHDPRSQIGLSDGQSVLMTHSGATSATTSGTTSAATSERLPSGTPPSDPAHVKVAAP